MPGAWTKNWDNMRKALAFDTTSTVWPINNLSGQAISASDFMSIGNSGPMSPVQNAFSLSSDRDSVVVRFGASDTPVTGGEYTLASPYTSGSLTYSTASNISKTNNFSDPDTVTRDGITYNVYRRTRVDEVLVQNLSASAGIIIREWGLVGRCGNYDYLLYRGVFEEAVTLAYGDSLRLTFTRSVELEVPVEV